MTMKVGILAGGLGSRLSEETEIRPKPMVEIGGRPILWRIMRIFAAQGVREFILCLGHRADVIKNYFLNYNEAISNDFVISGGGRKLKLLGSDISNWSITFVDTGIEANIGMRLRAVREHLQGEEIFLANYADNLTDAALPPMIEHLISQDKIASFISVKPSHTFHVVQTDEDSSVHAIIPAASCDIWINGGFFVFRQAIFDDLHEGEELVAEPFERLIRKNKLTTYKHTGFWACMDTFKEKMILEDLYKRGHPPWEAWKQRPHGRPAGKRSE